MRDNKRIDTILNNIETLWKQNPDLRLGQLLMNISQTSDLFYIEDDTLNERIIEKIKLGLFKEAVKTNKPMFYQIYSDATTIETIPFCNKDFIDDITYMSSFNGIQLPDYDMKHGHLELICINDNNSKTILFSHNSNNGFSY